MGYSKSNLNQSKRNLQKSANRAKSRPQKSAKPTLNEVIYLQLIETSNYFNHNFRSICISILLLT